jgi:hypothetical protein
MDWPKRFEIDPFLLPTCYACNGPLNLSRIEPATDHEPERRLYRCSDCNAEQEIISASE